MAKQTVKPADTAGVNKSQFIRDELTKNKKAMLRR